MCGIVALIGSREAAPQLLEGLRHMMTLRAFDARMQMAQRQGKTSFYMKSTGEEAVPTAAGLALDDTDMLFPAYRQQALLFVRNWPMPARW